MSDFLDIATSLRRSGRAGAYESQFDTVFEAIGALQLVHSKARLDILNIESVFAAFEFAQIIKSFCGYDPANIATLPDAARALITQTIEETVRFPLDHGSPQAPPPYPAFAELVFGLREWCRPAHDVVVVTFNYDFALDFAFRSIRPGVDYGLDERRTHADALPLLKLHGSISWAECSVDRAIVTQSFGDFMAGKSIAGMSGSLKIDFSTHFRSLSHCGNRVNAQPILVPPTWNKSSYHGVLASVWATAARELAAADNIFVIGYSLPDTDVFFRYLYALGTVGKHPLERFWVFDPDDTGAVHKRFLSLLGPGAEQRFRFVKYPFDAAINVIRSDLAVPAGPL